MFIKVKNFWKNKQTTWNRLFLPSCTIRLTFTVKITTQLLCILYLYLKYIEASDIRTSDIGTLRDVQKVLDIKYSFIISSTFRAEKGFKMFCKHLFKKSDGLWIYDTDIFDLSLLYKSIPPGFWRDRPILLPPLLSISRKMNEWLNERSLKLISLVFKVYKVFR